MNKKELTEFCKNIDHQVEALKKKNKALDEKIGKKIDLIDDLLADCARKYYGKNDRFKNRKGLRFKIYKGDIDTNKKNDIIVGVEVVLRLTTNIKVTNKKVLATITEHSKQFKEMITQYENVKNTITQLKESKKKTESEYAQQSSKYKVGTKFRTKTGTLLSITDITLGGKNSTISYYVEPALKSEQVSNKWILEDEFIKSLKDNEAMVINNNEKAWTIPTKTIIESVHENDDGTFILKTKSGVYMKVESPYTNLKDLMESLTKENKNLVFKKTSNGDRVYYNSNGEDDYESIDVIMAFKTKEEAVELSL